jgi:hypothetical protein
LRWAADGQNGYWWRSLGDSLECAGQIGGTTTVFGTAPFAPSDGDILEIRAFQNYHYLLLNSVVVAAFEDTDGVGPGAVGGHVYYGLYSPMLTDDFSCGNLGAASASDPEGLATFLESEGWTVALSGTVFTVDPGQVFTWQEAVEGVYASAILAPLRSDIDDFFGR